MFLVIPEDIRYGADTKSRIVYEVEGLPPGGWDLLLHLKWLKMASKYLPCVSVRCQMDPNMLEEYCSQREGCALSLSLSWATCPAPPAALGKHVNSVQYWRTAVVMWSPDRLRALSSVQPEFTWSQWSEHTHTWVHLAHSPTSPCRRFSPSSAVNASDEG